MYGTYTVTSAVKDQRTVRENGRCFWRTREGCCKEVTLEQRAGRGGTSSDRGHGHVARTRTDLGWGASGMEGEEACISDKGNMEDVPTRGLT